MMNWFKKEATVAGIELYKNDVNRNLVNVYDSGPVRMKPSDKVLP